MPRHRPKSSSPRPTQPPAAAKRTEYLDLVIYVGLILTILAVYAQVRHFSFVTVDDPDYVTKNMHVQSGLTAASIAYAFSGVVSSNWAPMTLLSHMAVCQLFGMESGAHHGINLLLHILSAMLLFAALQRATGARWPSAFVAFVFALHPLHVESVAWVSERKDVLSTFFWFAALYVYARYAERPNLRRYFLVLALFALGLMSKPMLVTFPFTLLLLDVWPFRRARLPRTLWEKVPFFALSAASSMVTYFIQRSDGAVLPLPVGERVSNALISYVSYIVQTFWPTGLAAFYPQRGSLPAWQAAGACAMLLGLSALAVFAWRTRPYIATGWFWYLGTLVPVVGLVKVGLQSHADRYMYVPMVGLSMILAWGAADAVRQWPRTRWAVASAAGLACLACLGLAHAQTAYWRNSETLYHRAIAVTKDNFFAQYSLAEYLLQFPDRGPEAVTHFEEALRIDPHSANSHNSIGGYLLQTGQETQAVAQFEAALRIKPDLAAAHFNLAQVYSKDPARAQDAIAQYEAALRAQPDFERAHRNLGIQLLKVGRTRDAMAHLEAALRIQPDPDAAAILEALRAQQH